MLVLGIDPGSRATGYGLIEAQGNKLSYVDSGCIQTGNGELPERLKRIFEGLSLVIRQHQPQQSAIEEVFMGRNAASALKLGQARGAAMSACLCYDLPVSEYSARAVKQAVVGAGAAEKSQVQHMVKALLRINVTIANDAADGLAVAICHANTQASLVKMAGAKSFGRKRLR
ncbi:MAG: crossover junction endodeoxyribonuclease RuvC [Gammaproteobacteria bacterium]|nr:crossover junction endodeoxyribonuclease RuvC [Gammaproteobacteria bacterium]MCY4358320.1 crossover junction endodeoxyribonuclease RuvC [Gammaproteobacteria bacterium]